MRRLLLFPVLFLLVTCYSSSSATGQICVTPDEVKTLVARVASPTNNTVFDKKLHDELIALLHKDNELVQKYLERKENKKEINHREEVDAFRVKTQERLCEILKERGWPSSRLVGSDGVAAAFAIFKNAPSYKMQVALWPVIVAAVEKNEIDKSGVAAVFDRLRLRAGMKQYFGTQATILNGFLVLAPIEAEAQLDERRREFDLPPMRQYLRELEFSYHLPLVRSPYAPAPVDKKQRTLDSSVLGSLLSSEAPDNVDVVRIETNVVSVNVSVYNTRLRSTVSDLEESNFTVFEDGHQEPVTFFEATTVPFDLVLLIDLSGSTQGKRDLIRKSTKRFIEAARPADRIAIVLFSTVVEVISPLTSDRGQLFQSINRIDATQGESHVWDALKFVLDNVVGPKTPDRRRAVVLMSDGVDNSLGSRVESGSRTTFAELIETVRHSDAMVIPIYLDTEGEDNSRLAFLKSLYENARHTLTLLAEESGGLYYKAKRIDDLHGVYEQVINDLGKVYSLGYKPNLEKHDGEWRSVKIELVGHPDLVPRARPGYYAN